VERTSPREEQGKRGPVKRDRHKPGSVYALQVVFYAKKYIKEVPLI
jgi:hypothetical protein